MGRNSLFDLPSYGGAYFPRKDLGKRPGVAEGGAGHAGDCGVTYPKRKATKIWVTRRGGVRLPPHLTCRVCWGRRNLFLLPTFGK